MFSSTVIPTPIAMSFISELGRRIRSQRPAPPTWSERRSAMSFLELFGEGVALCDGWGEVLYENSALTHACEADPEGPRVRTHIRALALGVSGTVGRHPAPAPTPGARCAAADAMLATSALRTAVACYRLRAAALEADAAPDGPLVLVSAERLQAAFLSVDQLCRRCALTASEARVVLLLAAGRTTEQIASALSISTHTARHHTEKAFVKLDVHRRADVADRLAMLFGG